MKKKSTEATKLCRQRTKERIVQAMGGCCQICKHSAISSLCFHHINPEDKEFAIGTARSSYPAWEKLIVEIKKCVLLCLNCHADLHAGIVALPPTYARFDERYAKYKTAFNDEKFKCPICKEEKVSWRKTCSAKCARKYVIMTYPHIYQPVINWPEEDVLINMIENFGYKETSRKLGCHETSVYQHVNKFGLRGKIIPKNKIIWPDDKTLAAMVDEFGYRGTGRKIGVSDKAVHNRVKRKGIL